MMKSWVLNLQKDVMEKWDRQEMKNGIVSYCHKYIHKYNTPYLSSNTSCVDFVVLNRFISSFLFLCLMPQS